MMSLMSLQLQSAYQGNLTWSMKWRSLWTFLGQFWPPNPKDNWRLKGNVFHQAGSQSSQSPQGCSFCWSHWRWFYFSRSEMTQTISSPPRWTPKFFNNHQSFLLKTIETEFEKLRFSEENHILRPTYFLSWVTCSAEPTLAPFAVAPLLLYFSPLTWNGTTIKLRSGSKWKSAWHNW